MESNRCGSTFVSGIFANASLTWGFVADSVNIQLHNEAEDEVQVDYSLLDKETELVITLVGWVANQNKTV
jgi:hypothetical protein